MDTNLKEVPFQRLAMELIKENPVLVNKIKASTGVSEHEILPLLKEVLCFLYLIGTTHQKMTPSFMVDMAWHEFILCTRTYHRFCNEHFDRYIHHQPGGNEGENRMKFQLTHEKYRELIDTPPTRFWGEYPKDQNYKANCGVCESI